MKSKVIGAVRLVTAFAILASIYWQVSDRMSHNVFRPEEYWAYFTIETSLLMGAVLLLGAWIAWFKAGEPARWFEISRVALAAAYIVVAVVYNALLRGSKDDARDIAAGYVWPTPPNEVLHVWAPIIVALEVLLVNPVIRLKLRDALWAAAFPILWLAGSIIRGSINHWWPYWFINPDLYGVPSMLIYIFGITVILIGTAMLLLSIRKLSSLFAQKAN
jgi:hypothetical protein